MPNIPNAHASQNQPTRIVILGGGYGGAYAAQALEKHLRHRPDVEIHLIDRNNYFVFYPLLVEAGTGSLEPRHAVVSIRSFLRRGRFTMADVRGVDFDSKTVYYQVAGEDSPRSLAYDHLVLALGSTTMLPPVPGLAEYGREMKSLADAVGLRDHAIHLLERADSTDDPELRRALLHFVVVGGNFSGVEVAGEFLEFLRTAARHFPNVAPRECNITLVEMQDRILGILQDRELSEFALEHLRKRGMNVELERTVDAITAESVTLSDGRSIPCRTVIWCAGIASIPLIKEMPLPMDPRGYILCEPDLRVQGHPELWAIGDCAVNIDADGNPYPATAQHAVRQGAHLGRNIARVLDGRPAEPCHIKSQGALAAIGCRTGVAKIFGIPLAGWPAWFLWRTVYLMKMPGWSRRVQIALDWTIGLFFKRDYVQLGLRRPDPRPRDEAPRSTP